MTDKVDYFGFEVPEDIALYLRTCSRYELHDLLIAIATDSSRRDWREHPSRKPLVWHVDTRRTDIVVVTLTGDYVDDHHDTGLLEAGRMSVVGDRHVLVNATGLRRLSRVGENYIHGLSFQMPENARLALYLDRDRHRSLIRWGSYAFPNQPRTRVVFSLKEAEDWLLNGVEPPTEPSAETASEPR